MREGKSIGAEWKGLYGVSAVSREVQRLLRLGRLAHKLHVRGDTPAGGVFHPETQFAGIALCEECKGKMKNEAARFMKVQRQVRKAALLEIDGFDLQNVSRDTARHLRFQVLLPGQLLESGEGARIAAFIELEKLAIGSD